MVLLRLSNEKYFVKDRVQDFIHFWHYTSVEEDVCEDEDVKPSEAAFVSQKRSHSEVN